MPKTSLQIRKSTVLNKPQNVINMNFSLRFSHFRCFCTLAILRALDVVVVTDMGPQYHQNAFSNKRLNKFSAC
jgi:hypothetical protein